MYIGTISNGAEVMIGKASPNSHIVITGMSGTGKSVRIADIEKHILAENGTIVVLDVNGTHSGFMNDRYNHISAWEDGLNIRFFDTSFVEKGEETMSNLIQYIAETLCPRQLRGACQLATVYKAIEYAIENVASFNSEMEALAYGLKTQNDTAATGAYNHLRSVLEGQIFRKSKKRIMTGKVNVISLQGINPKTQKRVVEIVLSVLWRKLRVGGMQKNKFTLVLDEFQNLDFNKENAFFQMLTESRKYGVNMILATQTLAIFSKKELAIINQAAVKLYFKPSSSDVKAIAAMINQKRYEKWLDELSYLNIGQAITVGDFEVRGRKIRQPILTYSQYCEENEGLIIRD